MKRNVKKGIRIVVGIVVVGLSLFFWIDYRMEKLSAERWTIALLRNVGIDFFYAISGDVISFPRDDVLTKTADQLAFLQELWRELYTGNESGIYAQNVDRPRNKYCDASIWTVIKNMPENPPENLIVLATRNVDPSSLRTRFSDGDIHKHIRFEERFEPPENMPILRKFAVLITAGGSGTIVPVIHPASRMPKATTYDSIYKQAMVFYGKEASFDLTTNLVNGLQVKYLTPEGVEVIPTND